MEINGDAFKRMQASMTAWSTQMTAINKDLMHFVQHRMTEDNQFARSLMSCRDLDVLATLQRGWLNDTMDDYSKAFSELWNVYTKALIETCQPLGLEIGKTGAAPTATEKESAPESAKAA
jgi:uncharacterized protein YukE